MTTAMLDKAGRNFLQCMEIWGGNRAIESGVSVPGIDAWIISRPHNGGASGGDVHYVSLCGGHKIARFAVADVSGHGEGVGRLAASLRGLMKKFINRVDQTRFVRKLNEEFGKLAEAGTYATALLATYFAPTDHLIVCNAGHPRPLWFHAATATWTLLDHHAPECVDRVSNLPLGIVSPTQYHQFAAPLGKNDLVVIYTDALIEATDAQGRPLGEEGLLAIARGLDSSRPAEFCNALLDAVAGLSGRPTFDDDCTVLLLHHNAADPTGPSVGEMVRAVGKMIGIIPV